MPLPLKASSLSITSAHTNNHEPELTYLSLTTTIIEKAYENNLFQKSRKFKLSYISKQKFKKIPKIKVLPLKNKPSGDFIGTSMK